MELAKLAWFLHLPRLFFHPPYLPPMAVNSLFGCEISGVQKRRRSYAGNSCSRI